MSHLQPTRSVSIRPGGSAVPGSRRSWDADLVGGDDLEPVDWDSRVNEYMDALDLPDEVRDLFATKLDETAEALALVADIDLEVARTKTVGAMAGAYGMVTDTIPLTLDDDRVTALLASDGDGSDPSDTDLVLARLAILHDELVRPTVADPTGGPDAETGEGPDGSVGSLPAPDPGEQPTGAAYGAADVPENAKDVVDWIADGINDEDCEARAWAALELETRRDGDPRKTVMAAIEAATGG